MNKEIQAKMIRQELTVIGIRHKIAYSTSISPEAKRRLLNGIKGLEAELYDMRHPFKLGEGA